jgi:hypothetical protein
MSDSTKEAVGIQVMYGKTFVVGDESKDEMIHTSDMKPLDLEDCR